jgi:hypothetical protein
VGTAINYFSQTEFQAFLSEGLARLRLEWLALTGRIFTARENEELRRRFEDFFRTQRQEKTPGRKILETFWEEDR